MHVEMHVAAPKLVAIGALRRGTQSAGDKATTKEGTGRLRVIDESSLK